MRQAEHVGRQCVEQNISTSVLAPVHGIKATGKCQRGELIGFGLGHSVCVADVNVGTKATLSQDSGDASHILKWEIRGPTGIHGARSSGQNSAAI